MQEKINISIFGVCCSVYMVMILMRVAHFQEHLPAKSCTPWFVGLFPSLGISCVISEEKHTQAPEQSINQLIMAVTLLITQGSFLASYQPIISFARTQTTAAKETNQPISLRLEATSSVT